MERDEGQQFLSFPKDLLECPVCFGKFNQPKVLPCQHTFCLSCIDRLRTADGQVVCPNCQRIAAVPPNGTSHLPTNYFLVHLLDVSRPTATDNRDVACDACSSSSSSSSCPTVAQGYCIDCAQSLCRTCVNAHSGIRSLRHHQLIGIDGNDPERLRKLLMDRPVFCVDHPTNEIAFHCQDCSTSICVKCGFLRHKNHDCVDIKEKAEEARREVDEMVEKLSQKISDCASVKQELLGDLEYIDETLRRIRNQIAEKTRDVVCSIRRQEKNLLKAVKEFEKQFKSPVEFSAEDVDLKVGNMETFVQFCRQLKDSGTHTDVINLCGQVIAKGEKYRAMSVSRPVVPSLVFSPSAKRIDEMNVLGDLEAGRADELQTTTSDCDDDLSRGAKYDCTHPLTVTLHQGVQENESTVTNRNQRSLRAQDSLESNEDESVDSTECSSSDHSLDEDCLEKKDYWDIVYSQQFDGAVRNDENVPQGNRNSCKERNEATISDLMSLQLKRRNSSSTRVVDTISGKDPVNGIAVLDFLYVLRQASNRLESYDLKTWSLVASREFDELRQPTDLAACAAKQTLYIGHTKKIVFSLKVAKPNSTPERLTVAFSYKHLSVTADASVLMGCPKADMILEYKEMPVWTELRRIGIPGSYPTSMVQISTDFFVVSSKMNVLYFVRSNGSSVTYERVSVPHNISHVAVDVGGLPRLLVANCYGHSVMKLDLSSSPNGPWSYPVIEPRTISQPTRLCADKIHRRLFVGTANGDVKILGFS